MPRFQVIFGSHVESHSWCVYDMKIKDCIAVCRTQVQATNIVSGLNFYEESIQSILIGD